MRHIHQSMARRLVAVMVCAVAGAALVRAQDASALPSSLTGRVETAHLIAVPSVTPGPDGRTTLVLDVTLKPKMHVYAPEETKYLPVSFSLAKPATVKAAAPVFPKGEQIFFEPTAETQIVYSDAFTVTQAIARPSGSAPMTVTGELRYQACDDRVCYLPKTISVQWKLP